MQGKISAVINTLNEEKNIGRVINSLKWADEILVCDMHSDDETAVIARKLGAKVIFHKRTGFVEPARNFAISKASHEWILIVDADEEIPSNLADHLKNIVSKNGVSAFVEVPRKNIIFGKWMKASMWWPDYNVRFFKAGNVIWSKKIHSNPKTSGQGIKLPLDERYAIIHHHYETIHQFLERLNRYTTIQAKELKETGESFVWSDLFSKPLNEFLSRYFASSGFKDGLHGLALSLLQSFSFLIVYLKLWEHKGFKEQDIDLKDFKDQTDFAGKDLDYWFKYSNLSKNPIKRFVQKVQNKI